MFAASLFISFEIHQHLTTFCVRSWIKCWCMSNSRWLRGNHIDVLVWSTCNLKMVWDHELIICSEVVFNAYNIFSWKSQYGQVGGFLQQNWPPWYNWNIVERDIQHHKTKPSIYRWPNTENLNKMSSKWPPLFWYDPPVIYRWFEIMSL
jgi:hypothetical protein